MPALVLVPMLTFASAGIVPGPPYATDDPEPVEYHHWEAYVASQYFHDQAGIEGTLPHFEVNYGAAPNMQIHLIAPYAYSQADGSPRDSGFGDTEVGVKFRFQQETKGLPMAGIFPLVELPTGAASRGLGNGEAQFFLPLWLQKSWGKTTSYGGGGYWHNPGSGNRDYWFVGWQAQQQVTKALSVGGEIFHTTPKSDDDTSHTAFNLGLVYDFDDGHHFLFSAGKDLKGSNVGSMYVAYQWTFGPNAKK